MELVKEMNVLDRDVFMISGALGVEYLVKSGIGEIKAGTVLSFDDTDGSVKPYVTGAKAFSVALNDCDATSEDSYVTVAMPITEFNKDKIIGINPDTDFTAVHELLGYGIILRGVDD